MSFSTVLESFVGLMCKIKSFSVFLYELSVLKYIIADLYSRRKHNYNYKIKTITFTLRLPLLNTRSALFWQIIHIKNNSPERNAICERSPKPNNWTRITVSPTDFHTFHFRPTHHEDAGPLHTALPRPPPPPPRLLRLRPGPPDRRSRNGFERGAGQALLRPTGRNQWLLRIRRSFRHQ